MKVSYNRLKVISDSRGLVFEPLVLDDFPDQRNAHIVLSMPGVVRGNHYHTRGKETIAVLGPALVRFREKDEIKNVEIGPGQAYRFVFPPGTPHAIKNLGNQPNILMASNTVEHDPQNPDSERAVLIEV
jgi:dTDP-4-dehydrorhamnose 3,5-epimerase-like enzyme